MKKISFFVEILLWKICLTTGMLYIVIIISFKVLIILLVI